MGKAGLDAVLNGRRHEMRAALTENETGDARRFFAASSEETFRKVFDAHSGGFPGADGPGTWPMFSSSQYLFPINTDLFSDLTILSELDMHGMHWKRTVLSNPLSEN